MKVPSDRSFPAVPFFGPAPCIAPKRQQAVTVVPPVAVEDDEDDLYMPGPPDQDVSASDQPTTISEMVVEVMAECPGTS